MPESELRPSQIEAKQPEQATHYGVHNYGITTSFTLFEPSRAMDIANELSQEMGRPVGVEWYTTVNRFPLSLAQKVGVPVAKDVIPPTTSSDYVQDLRLRYPYAAITGVHDAFSASLYEALLHRITVGEHFLPLSEGARQRAFHAYFALIIGAATSYRGIDLAESLDVSVDMHTNLLAYFERHNKLEDIKQRVQILAQPERGYRQPDLQWLGRQLGFSSEELASNPLIVRDQFVRRLNLAGMVYSADHATTAGVGPEYGLSETAQDIRVMHIAGGERTGDHGIIEVGDPFVQTFLEAVAAQQFGNDQVWLMIDGNPFKYGTMSREEQLRHFRKIFNWFDEVQQSVQ